MWRRWLTILSVSGLLVALLLWVETAYPPLRRYNENQQTNASSKKKNPGDDLARVIGSALARTVDAIESHHDLWLVLETLALVGFTGTLWWSTRRLWQSSIDHSEHMESSVSESARSGDAMERVATAMTQNVANTRDIMDSQRRYAQMQMRAYLSVIVGTAVYQESGRGIRFEAKPAVVNTGNTPAHDVTQNLRAEILPVPLPVGFAFPLPAQQAQGGAVIGPRQDRLLSAIVDQFVLDPDVPLIKQSVGRTLTVWGTVSYTDVFGDRHRTNFSQMLTWLPDDRVFGVYLAEHNSSD